MYSNFEILIIFGSISSTEEYDKVCKSFEWLCNYGYQDKSDFLHSLALKYFNKFYNA